MKTTLTLIITLLITSTVYLQSFKSTTIPNQPEVINYNLKAGTCPSPDGPLTVISSPPINYDYLEDNGYCLYTYPVTDEFTACFTFTAGSTSVSVNTGHSQSCVNTSFSNYRLFNSACTQIATGLSYTGLTIGQTYTWCLDMRAWGGPSCNGFTTVCPYYINIAPLPVDLINFSGKNIEGNNVIIWSTLTERNNDYFILEHSLSGEFDENSIIYIQDGNGTTSSISNYLFIDENPTPTNHYYRLSQVDFDGNSQTYKTININTSKTIKTLIKSLNIMGQEINKEYKGIVIYQYIDGTIEKGFVN